MKTQTPLFRLFTILLAISICQACNTSATNENAGTDTAIHASGNSQYAIASTEYSDLAADALNKLTALDFDAWGNMLADDVEYYFPDGDEKTRTKLTGKQAVLDWWKNWKATSGIKSMTATLPNHIPIEAKQPPNMTGLPGVYVFSYFTNNLSFAEKSASVRMNFAAHFNNEKKIDRFYTYYDRTPIIKAMGKNILEQ